MNLKKFAVTGLITLAIVAALCMYFSGTIVNITTPKVKLLNVKQGKLETSTMLTGTLVYTDTKDITITPPEESTLSVRQVYVRPGTHVEEGDLLFETEVNGFSSKMNTLQNEYADAVDALSDFNRKNTGVVLTRRDEEYAKAYTEWKKAARAASSAYISVKLKLTEQKLSWPDEAGYPDGADETLIAAIDRYHEAQAVAASTEATFTRAARFPIDDSTWEYIQEKESLESKVTEAEEKCIDLQNDVNEVRSVFAPSEGYITAVNVKTGENYDGNTAMYSMTTADGVPALQFDISDVNRNVAKGDAVTIASSQYGSVNAKVGSISFNSESKRCAYVTVTTEISDAFGSLYALGQMSEVEATLLSKTATVSCLVPVSAIHGSGNSRYVYIIDNTNSTLSGRTMSVKKFSINVIAESNGYAAINEDLSYYKLAYMEDRGLEDGSTVMEYTK